MKISKEFRENLLELREESVVKVNGEKYFVLRIEEDIYYDDYHAAEKGGIVKLGEVIYLSKTIETEKGMAEYFIYLKPLENQKSFELSFFKIKRKEDFSKSDKDEPEIPAIRGVQPLENEEIKVENIEIV